MNLNKIMLIRKLIFISLTGNFDFSACIIYLLFSIVHAHQNKQHDQTHGRTEFVRTAEQEKIIKNVQKLIDDCLVVLSEEYCLKTIFDSNYFWNK